MIKSFSLLSPLYGFLAVWPSRGFLFFLRLSWLQLFENRNSPRDLQVGAWVRWLLCGSDVYRQSHSLWGWVLVIGCLNWCMWGGWKGSEANQGKFVWKEVCLPFWGRGNGVGLWSRTSKAGAADETSWFYFSNCQRRSRSSACAVCAPVTCPYLSLG